MDVVDKYRLKRIARLEKRYGKFHGARFDADDEENGGSGGGSGKGGHGNTRIPYGLCQREGINIQKGWTPSDAWSALEGKGYSASSVYKELKSTGKVGGGKQPAKVKTDIETAKSVIKDFEEKRKRLDDMKSEQAQIEKDLRRLTDEKFDMNFQKNVAERQMENARKRLEDIGGKTVEELQEELEPKKKEEEELKALNRKIYDRPERGTPEYDEWKKWVEENGGRSAIMDKIDSGLIAPDGVWHDVRVLEKKIEDIKKFGQDGGYGQAKEEYDRLAEKVKKSDDDIESLKQRKSQLESDYSSAVKEHYDSLDKYREAALAVFDEKSNSDKVKEYDKCEQELRIAKAEDAKINEKLSSVQSRKKSSEESLERKKKFLEDCDPDDFRKSMYENDVERLPKLIEEQTEEIHKLSVARGESTQRLSKLESRISELKSGMTPSEEKEWESSRKEYQEINTVHDGPYSDLAHAASRMRSEKVEYRDIQRYEKTPSDDTIIGYISGGDKTKGSCASVSFAYIANKAGYEVLDFRGGSSQDTNSRECVDIAKKLGAQVERGTNDFKTANALLGKMEEGKEYWFVTGKHAAMVRKKDGKPEYLELQSERGSGWYSLTDWGLKERFACHKTHSSRGRRVETLSCMIESEKLVKSPEFISYLGYINTAKGKEKKGLGGSVK